MAQVQPRLSCLHPPSSSSSSSTHIIHTKQVIIRTITHHHHHTLVSDGYEGNNYTTGNYQKPRAWNIIIKRRAMHTEVMIGSPQLESNIQGEAVYMYTILLHIQLKCYPPYYSLLRERWMDGWQGCGCERPCCTTHSSVYNVIIIRHTCNPCLPRCDFFSLFSFTSNCVIVSNVSVYEGNILLVKKSEELSQRIIYNFSDV